MLNYKKYMEIFILAFITIPSILIYPLSPLQVAEIAKSLITIYINAGRFQEFILVLNYHSHYY